MSKNDKIKIVILVLLWAAVFYPLYPELVREWLGNSDNSHAFIVPLISMYFVWQRKNALQLTPITTSLWGGGLLGVSLLLYVLSSAGGLAFPARIAMVTSLFGLVWFCLGKEFIQKLAFPIAFLLFMVPVPYSLISLVSTPLQLMATEVSAALIGKCSIPVYREGNMLYFMQTQLEVAEACSGVRSIMALTMISFVFCFLSRDGWWRRAVLVIAAIPIAIVANIFRVTGTGVLAHFYGDGVARGFLHEFSGIAIFIFGFAQLFAVFFLVNRKITNDIR
ncbi:MAG: exosortase/archaeosortase family protein [Deltaproteobacteria bacterium]|jgi:exosortase|nr:exosortase/archaeosortase family protein [Deltaproteobacteria bacterium]